MDRQVVYKMDSTHIHQLHNVSLFAEQQRRHQRD